MRKRLALMLLPCSLLVSALMPATVSAAPRFRVTLVRDTCVSGAGKHGLGKSVLIARIVELGKSGANRFTFLGQIWHRPLHGRHWTKEYQWPQWETTFPNDKSSYWAVRRFKFEPAHNAWHKLAVRVQAWHGKQLLFTKSFVGSEC
jgi:hypothetical protein